MPRNKGTQKSRKRKSRRGKYKYQCRTCGRKFNNKKNGKCPNCGSRSIKVLVGRISLPILKSNRSKR